MFQEHGVGNKRKALTIETLGIPVIAIGVPTVVEAATIAIDKMEEKVKQKAKSEDLAKEKMYNLLKGLQEEDKYEMIKEILTPEDYNFIVTPKEIDDLIENMKDVVARGINFATQE